MIRKILTIVIPLLAPLVAYLVWVWFTAQRREALERGRRMPAWQEWPWAWLIAAGAVLLTVTLFTLGFADGSGTDREYTPAHYENGKLVPGTFSDKDGTRDTGTDR